MAVKSIFFIIAASVTVLIACKSDKSQIETVIEEGNKAGSIVHSEWKPETQISSEAITIEPVATPPIKEKAAAGPLPTLTDNKDDHYQLQIGAFTNKNNADKLVKKLEKQGYTPILLLNEFKGNKWNIVRIGPFQHKTQAETTARSLAATEKTDILIIHNNAVVDTIKAHASSEKPAVKTIADSINQSSQEKSSKPGASAPKPTSTLRDSQPIPTSDNKTTASDDKIERPYSFQVGGLYSAESAKEQLKRYQYRGYTPYLVEVKDSASDEKWYTIRIGNFKTLKEAVDEAAIFATKEQIPTHPRPIN